MSAMGIEANGNKKTNDINKRIVEEFFSRLQNAIIAGLIPDESALAEWVGITPEIERLKLEAKGTPRDKQPVTLLELLGYKDVNVANQQGIKAGVKKIIPDYIVQCNGKECFILDIKAPDVKLDGAGDQILSYLMVHRKDIPLGVLFNGTEMQIYINTRLKNLTSNDELSENGLVKSTNRIVEISDLWLRLSCTALTSGSLTLARHLVRQYENDRKGQQRQRRVEDWLDNLLRYPNDDLFAAISQSPKLWADKSVAPSIKDMSEAWLSLEKKRVKETPSATTKNRPNPTIKFLVARVCAKYGLDVLKTERITGITNLRIRNIGGNGYHQIPGFDNIFVGGVSSSAAIPVIEELERLLKEPNSSASAST